MRFSQATVMSYRIACETDVRHETRGRWQRHSLPPELGACHTDVLCLSPGLTLLHSRYCPLMDLRERSRKALPQPVLSITLGMRGQSAFAEQRGQDLYFASGCSTVSSFVQACGERQYRGGVAVQQLRVQVGLDALQIYLGEDRAQRLLGHASGVRQLACHASTGASLSHARALLWQAQQHPDDVLSLHAHTLSLLAEELRSLDAAAGQSGQRPARSQLSARDAARMDEARDWLLDHLDQSFQLKPLAQMLGVSESRLRRGFAQRFQQSPQAFHTQARMQKAQLLLRSGRRVADVAYQLGYEHPANFSLAFTRFFGYSPKSV